ncbi:MAG: BTAD domain-containing putative transcriptional regulator, partial [Thermacetogeniaceae bacterium]
WLPDNIHLVLIGRARPPLNLYRERCRGELLEIGQPELQFSATETGELMALLGIGLQGQDLADIQSWSEGWAILVGLLGMWLQSGGDWRQVLPTKDSQNFGHFKALSRLLLKSLRTDLHSFLQDASLLPYLDANLCNTALQRRDSSGKLEELQSCGILSRIDQETVTWRLHSLMSECLRQEALRERTPDQVIAIRQRAAGFLEEKGDIDRALEQIAACGDWPRALDLIHRSGDSYFLRYGRLDALHGWIARAPAHLVARDHWIMYFQGMSLLHVKPDEALVTLSEAADLASKHGDIRCQLRSLLLVMGAHAMGSDARQLMETAARIPLAASLLKDSWLRGVVLVAELGRATWSDDLRRGVWLGWLAGKAGLDDESRMTRVFCSSIIQYRLGHLDSARRQLEELLADPYVQENERWTGTADTIYAAVCMLSGDHSKMLDICRELLCLGQKYKVPFQLGVAHRYQAVFQQREGNLAEARSEYEASRIFFSQANNLFFARLTDLELVALRVETGEEDPRELLDEAKRLLDSLQKLHAGHGLDDYAVSGVGFIAMKAGDLTTAQQLFEELRHNCTRKGARHELAGIYLLLAQLHLVQGDESTCDACLRQALGAAETAKWENFWDWRAEVVYAMCWRALARGIHPYWAARLLRRWFPQSIFREAGFLLASDKEEIRATASVMVQELAGRAGRLAVHANCLGCFRLFINGIEIPRSEWKTQKDEKLFKLLLISKHNLTKKVVIAKLWPDSEPWAGDASLRTALAHIRRTLGLDRYGIMGVERQHGQVCLTSEMEIHTDYQTFADVARDGLRLADCGDSRAAPVLNRARELYGGVFLPDDLYEDWLADTRTWLQDLYLQVLSSLIDIYQKQDQAGAALDACQRYLTLEPDDEQVIRTAMKLYRSLGQRQKGIDLFQQLSAILADNYGIKPSPETVELYEQLKQ